MRPGKPTPDYPLFAHGNGQWAKKVNGKLRYYGPWADPQAALDRYNASNKPPSISPRRQAAKPSRPDKPHPDFPLYAHPIGQWAKKVKGKTHYFGAWADPQAALDKYLDQKDALLAGRTPTPRAEGLTFGQLANRFLHSKELDVQSGELKRRTWKDYQVVYVRVAKVFGEDRQVDSLTPADFRRLKATLAKSLGPVALGNFINRVRILFNWAYSSRLIAQPMWYGEKKDFAKPSRKQLREARNKKGLLMFQPDELRAMLGKASKPLKAMILLGVNCGFGNTDVATLPHSAVKNGWVNYPRPKTGIPRRVPLWPETLNALREALADRPRPRTALRSILGGRVFVTSRGGTWERTGEDNPVSKETAKLLQSLGLHKPGLNFYSLRRTFETIGGEAKDQVAVDSIMGHAPDQNDMAAVYRQTVSDARLQAVVNYVHDWLFGGSPAPAATDGTADVAGEEQPSDVA